MATGDPKEMVDVFATPEERKRQIDKMLAEQRRTQQQIQREILQAEQARWGDPRIMRLCSMAPRATASTVRGSALGGMSSGGGTFYAAAAIPEPEQEELGFMENSWGTLTSSYYSSEDSTTKSMNYGEETANASLNFVACAPPVAEACSEKYHEEEISRGISFPHPLDDRMLAYSYRSLDSLRL